MITPDLQYLTVLTCHPESYSNAVHGIQARVHWADRHMLAVTYMVDGDLSRLHIPGPQRPRRTDRLWQHTCFEAFLSLTRSSTYYEFNFSPSGEWAAYAFDAYREGMKVVDKELEPDIVAASSVNSFKLDTMIRLDRLPLMPAGILQLGLSAVIEERCGMLSYWALKHPPGKPDFHHPDGFALQIALPA